jgi:hypothetical protein
MNTVDPFSSFGFGTLDESSLPVKRCLFGLMRSSSQVKASLRESSFHPQSVAQGSLTAWFVETAIPMLCSRSKKMNGRGAGSRG